MNSTLGTKSILKPSSNADTTVKCIDWNEPPFPLKLITMGLILVIIFVSILATWTLFAPIESAVVAPGIVSAAGHRKQIQHLEGGIVEKILVQDGDQVSEGQLLLKLRDVQPTSELHQLERHYIKGQALLARLIAERDNSEEIEFPEELKKRETEPAIASLIADQNTIFLSRKNVNNDKRLILEHKIAQKKEEIIGLQGQIKAKKQQQRFIKEELAMVKEALKRDLLPKTEGLKLQQRLAQTNVDLSEYRAEIERLQKSIFEIQAQISETHTQWISDIAEQVRHQRALLYDLSQQIIATSDVLQRTKIVSPIDGIVVNLQVHTINGVIEAGKSLLEILPSDDELVVYAYIAPRDIEEVKAGMPVNVKLTSFSRRQRIPLKGVVSTVSADRLFDPKNKTKTEYYHARIELDPNTDTLAEINLVAGMGADVFIRTGSRTPLDYLLSPIIKSFQQGFKEK